MNRYSSDSDDSIEHMKLDLLKAKFLHQKLKKTPSTGSNISRKNIIVANPIRGHCNPKFSVSKGSRRNETLPIHSPRNGESKEDSEESRSCSDDGNEEIITMNNYADYLLDKRRGVSNDEINAESNPSSSVSQRITSSQQDPSADGYHRRDNGDYSVAYNPSLDILAQWRLRRKLTEAQHSVKSEHQKHNLRINSLQYNEFETTPVSSYLQILKPESNKNIFTDFGCDKIPVRDIQDIQSNANSNGVVKAKNSSTDSGCQCNLDSTVTEPVKNNEKIEDNVIKTKHVRKHKRTIGIMATGAPRLDASTLTDGCAVACQARQSSHLNESQEWDNQSTDRDYIDIAIQKTLQNQLFDRGCHSALSVVTSLNGSQTEHTDQQLDTVEHSGEVAITDVNYGEKLVPWDEQFEIKSDNEFNDDDVLTDLRRRRSLNLDKLRILSLQIQNQTGKFPCVELS